ncbi:MAG: pseudouridine synthase [Actinomycetes bacterium]
MTAARGGSGGRGRRTPGAAAGRQGRGRSGVLSSRRTGGRTGKPGRFDQPGSFEESQRGRKDEAGRRPPASAREARGEGVLTGSEQEGVRLQKVLAQAGVASRRASEDLIAAGRVSVNGDVITELGVRVDPATAVIHVDGMRVQLDTSRVYLALNKPRGVVSTMSDPEGRPCLGDLVGDRSERLFHVGRLDVDTEGLLLLTNDGDLAHRLQHPSYGIEKAYLAEIPGPVPRDLGRRLRAGIELDDGLVVVDSFKLVDSKPGRALVEVVLHEGRNHVVRRLLATVGHPVLQLVRTRIGPVRVGDLLPGRHRPLTRKELGELMAAAGV